MVHRLAAWAAQREFIEGEAGRSMPGGLGEEAAPRLPPVPVPEPLSELSEPRWSAKLLTVVSVTLLSATTNICGEFLNAIRGLTVAPRSAGEGLSFQCQEDASS